MIEITSNRSFTVLPEAAGLRARAISYSQYIANFSEEVSTGVESEYSPYLPLNLQRSTRISRTIKPDPSIVTALKKLPRPVTWLVLSEHWCGDAAQLLPVMDALATAAEGKVSLLVLYRDKNPQLMDLFLTEGSRSIPKLIQLNEKDVITATWGPRPKPLQTLFHEWRAAGLAVKEVKERVHQWYAQDRQQTAIRELSDLILTSNQAG